MSIIDIYAIGDSLLCGITVTDKLDVQQNPSNGVEVTIIDPDGSAIINAAVATQGQYDEDNANTTGQYYYVFQSGPAHVIAQLAGIYKDYGWRIEYLIDPGGAYEGLEVVDPAFILEE